MIVLILSLIAVVVKADTTAQLRQIDAKTKQQEIDTINQQLEINTEKLEEAQGDQKKLQEVLDENKKLQREIEALQARKAEKQRIAAQEAQNAVLADAVQPQAVSVPSGDWVAMCHDYARQAGIVLTDSAIKLLERESHCSHTAQNPTSSACGIAQNINGCGSAGYGFDPISQIIWFHNYCMSRYGGFDGALQHSLSVGWY